MNKEEMKQLIKNLESEAETWLGTCISQISQFAKNDKIYAFIEDHKRAFAQRLLYVDLSNYKLVEKITKKYICEILAI